MTHKGLGLIVSVRESDRAIWIERKENFNRGKTSVAASADGCGLVTGNKEELAVWGIADIVAAPAQTGYARECGDPLCRVNITL